MLLGSCTVVVRRSLIPLVLSSVTISIGIYAKAIFLMRQNDDDIAFEKRDVELSFGVALHLTFLGNVGVVELVEICASA